MTHPIYSQTTLELLSTSQVKDIAKSIGAIPDGDKRVKQTWISALIHHQKVFTPAKFKAMEAHVETVMNRLEPIPTDEADNYVPPPVHMPMMYHSPLLWDSPTTTCLGEPLGATEWEETTPTLDPNTQSLKPNPQVSEQTVPTQQRGASIVALIVVLAFSVGLLIIKTGFTSIAWVLTALSPLALHLSRYLVPNPESEESIDYFPLPVS